MTRLAQSRPPPAASETAAATVPLMDARTRADGQAPSVSCLLNGICEVTLEARDLQALLRFYSDVLGCPVISREADRVWLACGPRARLGLWLPGPKEFGDQGG